MAALEAFIHNVPEKFPTLVKAALAHVQFETIHPFLDGNGRLGRLLITLLLCAEGALSEPALYLSLYFKTRRLEYYDRLQRVRTHGDWEGWIRFFLEGVIISADEALDTSRRVLALFESDRQKIAQLGRATATAIRVHELMQNRPVTNIREVATAVDVSYPTATSAMQRMTKLGILSELTGYARNRVFSYAPYIDILNEGTEPIG